MTSASWPATLSELEFRTPDAVTALDFHLGSNRIWCRIIGGEVRSLSSSESFIPNPELKLRGILTGFFTTSDGMAVLFALSNIIVLVRADGLTEVLLELPATHRIELITPFASGAYLVSIVDSVGTRSLQLFDVDTSTPTLKRRSAHTFDSSEPYVARATPHRSAQHILVLQKRDGSASQSIVAQVGVEGLEVNGVDVSALGRNWSGIAINPSGSRIAAFDDDKIRIRNVTQDGIVGVETTWAFRPLHVRWLGDNQLVAMMVTGELHLATFTSDKRPDFRVLLRAPKVWDDLNTRLFVNSELSSLAQVWVHDESNRIMIRTLAKTKE